MGDRTPTTTVLVHHFGPRLGEAGGGGMAAVVARHLSLGVPATEVRTTPTMRLGSRMRSAELMPAALVALVRSRAVARRRSVVIHVHVADGGSLVREGGLVRLAHRMGLPTVATVHASVLPDVVAHDGDRLRSVLERADAVHALGDRSARLLATVTDRPESIRVIPNWVDLPPDDPAPGDVGEVVVFAGLVGRRKGADVLLEAWPQVRAARPTAQLVVAGPASDVDCPPLPGVRYTGPVTPADVASLLATCRVAVLPSRHEAMPMFVLEAMSHGRPVVATAVGDVASVLNATSLVTPGDSGALAGALIEVLADPRQASVRGAANRAVVVDRFSPAAVRAQYASLYHDVLVARGRPVPDLLLGVDP